MQPLPSTLAAVHLIYSSEYITLFICWTALMLHYITYTFIRTRCSWVVFVQDTTFKCHVPTVYVIYMKYNCDCILHTVDILYVCFLYKGTYIFMCVTMNRRWFCVILTSDSFLLLLYIIYHVYMMHGSPCVVFMNIHQDGTQYMCATLVNTITSFTAARQRERLYIV